MIRLGRMAGQGFTCVPLPGLDFYKGLGIELRAVPQASLRALLPVSVLPVEMSCMTVHPDQISFKGLEPSVIVFLGGEVRT